MALLWRQSGWTLSTKIACAFAVTISLGGATTFVVVREVDTQEDGPCVSSEAAGDTCASRRRARSAGILGMAVTCAWALFASAALARSVRRIGRAREELERHVARVETANRELDAFAGRIAHDLRNVLSPVAMLPALLRRRAAQDGDPRSALTLAADAITRSTVVANRVLEGLLAFAHAGTIEEDDVTPSIMAVVEEVTHELEPARQRVSATIEHDLVDCAVRCPPALLHVLVMNLVSNAYKFLEGSPRREVRVMTREVGEWCELLVEDSGPGVPAEHRTRIFEPFYRVPGTGAPGHGIGLATVQRIADACGGEVAVEARVEGGAVFRARLRLAGSHARGARNDDGPPSGRGKTTKGDVESPPTNEARRLAAEGSTVRHLRKRVGRARGAVPASRPARSRSHRGSPIAPGVRQPKGWGR